MHWLAAIVASILLIAVTWKWGSPVLELFRDRAALQAWITSFGAWAPLVSIALNADVLALMYATCPAKPFGVILFVDG
jgi:uncharacterized membrane protein YdjX (TVP38/TMEM64 family)